jgi:hypothetical protein
MPRPQALTPPVRAVDTTPAATVQLRALVLIGSLRQGRSSLPTVIPPRASVILLRTTQRYDAGVGSIAIRSVFCLCIRMRKLGWGKEAMQYVEASGAKLYFEESGYGYPIIFIHEFASDMRGWQNQIRHFSRCYRCITYNARGYPPSDVPEHAALYG